jgi:hypothetical protein
MKMSKEEYNNIPVLFCNRCLSLRIRQIDDEIDFCDECGDIDISETHIEKWEIDYEKKYNKKFIQLNPKHYGTNKKN